MTYPIDTIHIYNGASHIDAPVTDSAERAHSLQQHNYVKLVWKSATSTPIVANAYIEYDGQKFYCVDDYYPTRKDNYYEYDIEFHALEDTLNRPIFFRYVEVTDQSTQTTTTWKEAEFAINGNLKTIANIIINSLNNAGYGVYFVLYADTMEDTTLQSYSFSGQSIADALANVAEQNETEYWFEYSDEYTEDGKQIVYLHFEKCELGDNIDLSDAYTEQADGSWASGGLKSVSQSGNVNTIPQKIYVYGSERNIIKKTVEEQTEGGAMNVSYDKKLRLPVGVSTETLDDLGVTLTFDGSDSSITIGGINNKFEQVKTFDEIYPKMTMTIESVSVLNPASENPIYYIKADKLKSLVVESPYDDSINPGKLGLLLEGCTLMATFTSGLLNGREFECAWRESTAEIGIVPVDENDVQIPNGVFLPKAGDTFILWNLAMPTSAVTEAQEELKQEAIEYIREIVTSITDTDCVSEPEAFRLGGYTKNMQIGQRVTIKSDVFRNGNLVSRIIKYSYKLTKPYDVNFTLASSRQTGRLATLQNMIVDATHEVHSVGQVQRAISRRQWHDTEEMMSMLDSIQKQMVVVGDENNSFTTTCSVEYSDDTKILQISNGYIQHQSYTENEWKGAWLINDNSQFDVSALDSKGVNPFYVFFLCNKNDGTGYAKIGTALDMENDDYYVFLLGILSSEFEGKRIFNQSSGLTSIAGGTITTDVIQDPARRLIIDYSNATIRARNGAKIIGKITFMKEDESENDLSSALDSLLQGVNDAQDSADNAQSTADSASQSASEAKQANEQLRSDYESGIATLESTLNENLSDAVATINGDLEGLQKQVDGEVNSWFLEGEPTLTNEPAVNWTTDEEKERHKGDTYTDITTFVDSTTTPTAGQSWRWCNVDDEYGTGWHWHKIADSDAVKALAEAGKAQSTADGKSTIFVVQPTNYKKGDMWVLQSDSDHTAGKKGDILNASQDSATYNSAHWSKEVKYTDDTAVDNLQIGGTNILPFTKTFKSNPQLSAYSYLSEEKYNDFVIRYYDATNLSSNYMGFAAWNTINQATNNDEFTCSFYAKGSGNVRVFLYSNSYNGLYVIKTTTSQGNTWTSSDGGCLIYLTDTWTRYWVTWKLGNPSSVVTRSNNLLFRLYGGNSLYLCGCQLEKGNKATQWTPAPEDIDAEIADTMNAIETLNDDGIFQQSEKLTIRKEWEEISGTEVTPSDSADVTISTTYGTNGSYQKTIALIPSGSGVDYSALTTAIGDLRTYLNTYKLYRNNAKLLRVGQTDPAVVSGFSRSTLSTKFANYYNAESALIKSVNDYQATKAASDIQIGGVNILKGTKEYKFSTVATHNYNFAQFPPTTPLLPNTNYVFSIEKSELLAGTATQFTIYIITKELTTIKKGLTVNISSERQVVAFTTPSSVVDTDIVIIYNGVAGSASGNQIKLTKFQLELGNKATAWKQNEADVIEARTNLVKEGMMMVFNAQNGFLELPSTVETLKANTEYVLSIERASSEITFDIEDENGILGSLTAKTNQSSYVVFSANEIQIANGLYLTNYNYTEADNVTLIGVKLAEGNKYVGYEATPEEKDAIMVLESAWKGTTDINGGLVLTNTIQLKDKDNSVTAGINGISTSDNSGKGNLFAWAGGTITDALSAILNKDQSMPVLLTREGNGSNIGCLVVEDTDKIRVTTANGSVLIDADGGLTLYDSNGISTVKIKPDNVTESDLSSSVTFGSISAGNFLSNTTATGYYELSTSFTCKQSGSHVISVSASTTPTIKGTLTFRATGTGTKYVVLRLELVLYDTTSSTEVFTYSLIANTVSCTTGSGLTVVATSTNNESFGKTNLYKCNLTQGHSYKFRIKYVTGGIDNVYTYITSVVLNASVAITNAITQNMPETIIGNNGVIISQNSMSYFFVNLNSTYYTRGLNIKLKGLPTSDTDLEDGQLYDTGDGVLRIK